MKRLAVSYCDLGVGAQRAVVDAAEVLRRACELLAGWPARSRPIRLRGPAAGWEPARSATVSSEGRGASTRGSVFGTSAGRGSCRVAALSARALGPPARRRRRAARLRRRRRDRGRFDGSADERRQQPGWRRWRLERRQLRFDGGLRFAQPAAPAATTAAAAISQRRSRTTLTSPAHQKFDLLIRPHASGIEHAERGAHAWRRLHFDFAVVQLHSTGTPSRARFHCPSAAL